MHTILWEFRVSAERRAAFEAAYGADGAWTRLFARTKGFLSVELLHCGDEADRYVTVDRWRSRADFEAFKHDFGAEYAALDRRLDGMSERETCIGAFNSAAGN